MYPSQLILRCCQSPLISVYDHTATNAVIGLLLRFITTKDPSGNLSPRFTRACGSRLTLASSTGTISTGMLGLFAKAIRGIETAPAAAAPDRTDDSTTKTANIFIAILRKTSLLLRAN